MPSSDQPGQSGQPSSYGIHVDPLHADLQTPHNSPLPGQSGHRPIWQRCVCDQFGRCLTDCPSADLDRPGATSYWDRRHGRWVERG